MKSSLWERIHAARTSARKTQQEIATACGVSRVAVGHWESADSNRRTVPGIESLKAIAETTGAPLEWLLSDDSIIDPSWQHQAASTASALSLVEIPLLEDKLVDVACLLHGDRELSAEQAAAAAGATVAGLLAMNNQITLKLHGTTVEPRLFACMLQKRSPMASFHHGDLVIVDPDWPFAPNSAVLAKTIDCEFEACARFLKFLGAENGLLRIGVFREEESAAGAVLTIKERGDFDQSIRKAPPPDSLTLLGRIIAIRRPMF